MTGLLCALAIWTHPAQAPMSLSRIATPSPAVTEIDSDLRQVPHVALVASDGKAMLNIIWHQLFSRYRLPDGGRLPDLAYLNFFHPGPETGYRVGTGYQIMATPHAPRELYPKLQSTSPLSLETADRLLVAGLGRGGETLYGDIRALSNTISDNHVWTWWPPNKLRAEATFAARHGDGWRVLVYLAEWPDPKTTLTELRLDPRSPEPKVVRSMPDPLGPGCHWTNAKDNLLLVAAKDQTTVYAKDSKRSFPTPAGKVTSVFGTPATCVWQLQTEDRYDLAVRDAKGDVTYRRAERIVASDSSGTVLMIHRTSDDSYWLARLR